MVTKKIIVPVCAVVFGILSGHAPVYAVTFETGLGDLRGTWSTNVTAAAGLRTKNPSCSLTGDTNYCPSGANTSQWSSGDNGDLNYGKDHFYTANLQITSELLLTAPQEGWKFLTRATSIFDAAASDTERTDLSDGARQQIVRNVLLLDLWLEKDFALADERGHVRVGNQVINWGESVYAFGGINATNALDVQKLYTPGTQLKQVLLPAPMVSFQSDLPGRFSMEGYIQPHWNEDRYPPVGTFWSFTDVFGRGALPASYSTQNFNVGGVDSAYIAGPYNSQNPYQQQQINQNLVNGVYAGAPYYSLGVPYTERTPDKSALQYGFRANYKTDFASFSAYFLSYTDKLPVLTYLSTESAGEWSYLSNRKLFGLSTNLPLGDWAIGGELSYRPKDAVAMTGCYLQGGPSDANTNLATGNCAAYRDFHKWQLDVNGQLQSSRSSDPYITGGLLHATTSYLTIELTGIRYPGVNANTQYTSTVDGQKVYQMVDAEYALWLRPSAALGYPIAAGGGTANSFGATVDFNWTYDGSIIPGWAVTPGATFYDAFSGKTPTFSANYENGYKALNLYVLFNQNPSTWQAGINYASYFGGTALTQPFADRNNIGVFITRNF